MWTDRTPTVGQTPSTPPRHPQLSRGNSLEEQVRGMIISGSPGYRQNSQGLSLERLPPPMPFTPHPQDQLYQKQDYSVPLPSGSPGFNSQLLPINPSPHVPGRHLSFSLNRSFRDFSNVLLLTSMVELSRSSSTGLAVWSTTSASPFDALVAISRTTPHP